MDDENYDDGDHNDEHNDDADYLHSTGSCHEELHCDICAVDPSRCEDREPGKALHRDMMTW